MARYTGPKTKISRKFGESIFGEDKSFEKRNYPPGQHGNNRRKPKKSEYRKFKIKSVDDNNDFASIQEIVFRRYNRAIKESSPLPNLILIDGGKGQLSAAGLSLKKLGLEHIPIVGLAKRLEEVYVPDLKDPQSIEKQSSGLILLRKIRDEAHRFAITFQKKKRNAHIRIRAN